MERMKPYISFYEGGHDPNITIYDPKTENFYIYELEKVLREKNFQLKKPWVSSLRDRFVNAVKFCLEHARVNYGIENDFSDLYFKSSSFGESYFDRRIIKHGKLQLNRVHHHDAHSWCGYAQSPFDHCAVISWDGAGDDTSFRLSTFDNWRQKDMQNSPFQHSKVYMRTGLLCKVFETTHPLSVSGKVMGLSAYGKLNEKYYEYFRYRMRTGFPYHKTLIEEKGIMEALNQPFFYGAEATIENKEAYDILYSLQKALEDDIVEWIEKNYIQVIEEMDNNLILTGGTALNVLANERIKRAFPHINVFVPPNCGDSGQSFGMMVYHLSENGMIDKKVNCAFMGPKLWDYDRIPEFIQKRNAKKVTVEDIAAALREQKIIGLCQGNLECGPRALGNRSIICDASNPKMKDILNAKVKFREWFRPFAPICKKEDAHKYFYSTTFDNMEMMQFIADVKPEYHKELPAITHFDNTARLQVVTKEFNERLYNILDAFDGVLINTSFNVQGMPILNSMEEAFDVLDDTGLDHVVVEYEGNYWMF